MCSYLVIVTREIIKSTSGDLHFALQLFIQEGNADAWISKGKYSQRKRVSELVFQDLPQFTCSDEFFIYGLNSKTIKDVIIKLAI